MSLILGNRKPFKLQLDADYLAKLKNDTEKMIDRAKKQCNGLNDVLIDNYVTTQDFVNCYDSFIINNEYDLIDCCNIYYGLN